ncbi:hypothetical protein [Leifsonia sp. fls2-241-R2A-40a]|uniref:hypothetical protein n=1 Tax=Leifsonia sp. fls2-241-R2A-40a TaxID=3040290 RepID=UPI00254D0736|nr:hypothetical protein [Leifsonia sp. fls2-241-R2A-40a]
MPLTFQQRRARIISTACVALISVATAIVGAAPAEAASTPAFEIFYSPNCNAGVSASRVYTGLNSGEHWISDTFNSKQWGAAGYGQLIRNNAASIWVSSATVNIFPSSATYATYRSAGQCFNLNELRNRNVVWSVTGL